jgi:hypothetical protein
MDGKTIRQVWEKGHKVDGAPPNEWRKDDCGAWMYFAHHGKRDSLYGWEIDHINPGGGENVSNLRPLQWANNVKKSDGQLKCAVESQGNKNVSVGTVSPFHFALEGVHHNNTRCPTGSKRRVAKPLSGTGNKPMCADCRKLVASGT